ncbi:hypothetical protein FO519_007747 [Halicephalobus sp. NKZ332]|nr:hypothetical protein FO519_007747 [Halicephalobus sp. NKZ332]
MLFRRFLCLQNIPKSNFLWSSKFIIDERKGEREVVLSNWRTKKSGRSLRIEKADLEDLEIIASQTCQGYINANSLFIKMGATMEEMLPMFRKRTRNIINQRLSLIAFDEKDRLVGMIGSEVIERVEEIKKAFGPRGQPVLEIKEDYAQG